MILDLEYLAWRHTRSRPTSPQHFRYLHANRAYSAVTPDEAAKTLVDWTSKLDISKTGEYWAPRGPRDIGTAEPVLGSNLPTPLKLPW